MVEKKISESYNGNLKLREIKSQEFPDSDGDTFIDTLYSIGDYKVVVREYSKGWHRINVYEPEGQNFPEIYHANYFSDGSRLELNWSASGNVTVEEAREFSENLEQAIAVVDILNKEFYDYL